MEAFLFTAGLICMVVAAWITSWVLGLFTLGFALTALALGMYYVLSERR